MVAVTIANHSPSVRLVRSLDRDAGEQAANRRGDLEQHAEPKIDQLASGGSGRDHARGRNHRHQADGHRDLEVETQPDVEERHEKHAAANAE